MQHRDARLERPVESRGSETRIPGLTRFHSYFDAFERYTRGTAREPIGKFR